MVKRNRSKPGKLYRVKLHEHVLEDLAQIGAFIAKTHPFNAERYVDRLFVAMDRLARLPNAHSLAPSLAGYGARRMLVGSHYVLFRVHEDVQAVHVLRVVHTKEDLGKFERDFTEQSRG